MRAIYLAILPLFYGGAVLAADGEALKALTPLQRHVTMEGGTEKPFDNAYWNNKEAGIYVDVISGEPLFSSTDKYDSGTGWPSFTKPIAKQGVVTKEDRTLGMTRTEVKSASGAHLGHVFKDGPKEKGGLRYCINSAALRFVPKEELAQQGYGEYLPLFGEKAKPAPVKKSEAALPAPQVIALYFYADWCPNCKLLSPKLAKVRKDDAFDSKPVVFVTLDLTSPASIYQSKLLASALGVGEFVKQQGSATGYVALLDAATHKEIGRFDSSDDEAGIAQAIAKGL